MDFKNANELLALCEEKNLPISEIMRIREIELGELGETASEIINKKMTQVLGIMNLSKRNEYDFCENKRLTVFNQIRTD